MTNENGWKPLKEGLTTTPVPKPQAAATKPRTEAPMSATEPVALRRMAELYGATKLASMIGCSSSHISQIVRGTKECRVSYELAARHLESLMSKSTQDLLTPRQCLDGLKAYYSSMNVFDLTEQDSYLLSKKLGEILREMK